MPDVKIKIEGAEQLRKLMSDGKLIGGPLADFLQRAAFIVESNMKQLAPVDTGHMRAGITSVVSGTMASVGPTVTYAPYVEYGTQPHFPPPSALNPWAQRHGWNNYALARWIALHGTKAHPFAGPAAQKSLGDIRKATAQLLTDIKAGWNKHAV